MAPQYCRKVSYKLKNHPCIRGIMNTATKVLLAIGIIILLVLLWIAGSYNGLVKADVSVEQAWADVEVQYQRRFDLIPNIVETVRGFAKQELTVFTEVTQLRSQWATAQSRETQIGAANELNGALSRLLLVAESYPQLKSNENFLNLQAQLEGTENRVAVARNRYNEAAKVLNIKVRRFPTMIIANMFGFDQATLFEAEQGSAQAPKVTF